MDRDLVEEAKQEIAQLPASLNHGEAAREAAKILADKLGFIDSICIQRDEIEGMLRSAEAMTALFGEESIQTSHEGIRKEKPLGRRRTRRAQNIRDAARTVLVSTAQPTTSSELAEALRSEDGLEDIDSSTISAALQYGEKHNEFVSRKEKGKLLWSLPGPPEIDDEVPF